MHIKQESHSQHEPWNAGRIVGAKPPLKPRHTGTTHAAAGSASRFPSRSPTKDALAAWLAIRRGKGSDWLWPSRSHGGGHATTRQHGRLVDQWVGQIGLNPADYGRHSLRRTKVSILYRRTGNLRACRLLRGHTKLEGTVRHLGIEVDDALSLSEQTEI